jgi:hypothetical protein
MGFGNGFSYVRMCTALTERFTLGESIEGLADDFGMSAEEVLTALRQEIQLMKEPKTQARFKRILSQYDRKHCRSMRIDELWYAIKYSQHKGFKLPDWVLPELRTILNPEKEGDRNA